MTTKKLFNLLIICMIMMLVSGCEYLYGEKRLDFKTVYVGFNGPDIGRSSYYHMDKITTYTDAVTTQNSWLKTALSADALKKIVNETDFNQQFILIYMSDPIAVFNTLEVASIGYRPPNSADDRVGLNVFTYRNLPSNGVGRSDNVTYPFTVVIVEKPKEPNAGFYAGGSHFEQNRASKAEKLQTGIARTFKEVKNDGAKLVTIELLYLGLEQCLTLRKQAPAFCSEADIKRMHKNIDLAIEHYDESTPTLESIINTNLKTCLEMRVKNPEYCDDQSLKGFPEKIAQAVAIRTEILNKVAENKRNTTNENP